MTNMAKWTQQGKREWVHPHYRWSVIRNGSTFAQTDARYTLFENGSPVRGFRYLADARRYAEDVIKQSRKAGR